MDAALAEDRLTRAERHGLRLAILCRTLAVGAALVWLGVGWLSVDQAPPIWAFVVVAAFTLFGIVSYLVIGTRFDRWWLKCALYAADILGVCALFVVLPVSQGADVPQIIAFRAYGIYYLFPLIAMACLTLSWRLVAWSGAIAVIGWWVAFGLVIAGMENRLSWGDMAAGASRQAYEEVFLSPDFIGLGNRVEETGFLLIGALILALAVYRARRVFFAQIEAEAQKDAERAERERIGSMLGRYVPEAIAARLMADEAALEPQVRHGVVLVMDVRDFTQFAAGKDPKDVIEVLNAFLARSADVIAEHDGVVIAFTGDGLLATFNTPLDIAAPERAALMAARALRQTARGAGFALRVGVAAGPVASGSVGSSERQAFTVYGDTVNRAARLEALAKTLGETVLMDESVARAVDEELRPLGLHEIKGFASPVDVWADRAR